MHLRPMFLLVSFHSDDLIERVGFTMLQVYQLEPISAGYLSAHLLLLRFSPSPCQRPMRRYDVVRDSPLYTIVVALLIPLVGSVDDTTSIPRSRLDVGYWSLLW